jgi:hypothetical protein
MSLTLRRVWPFEFILGHLGAHFEDTGAKKILPKASKGNFVDIVNTLIFLWFLQVSGGLGSPVDLQMVAFRSLGEQLGTH